MSESTDHVPAEPNGRVDGVKWIAEKLEVAHVACVWHPGAGRGGQLLDKDQVAMKDSGPFL